MTESDTLIATMQRQIAHKMRDTLSSRWVQMIVKLEAVRIGRDPSAYYDTKLDQAVILRDRINAVRSWLDASETVFEHIGRDACDFGGVKDIGFEHIRAEVEDWLSNIDVAATNLEVEAAEMRAEAGR